MKHFQAIVSYSDKEQEIVELDTSNAVSRRFHNEDAPSEAEVLFNVLYQLTAKDRAALVKVSLCQLYTTVEQAAGWILKSGGKHYFGPYRS